MEAKLTKDEQIQLLHLMIQLIVFSSHLAIAPLMHRTADDAHPIHGRNHCPPIFFLSWLLFLSVWTYLLLKELCCRTISLHSLRVLWGLLVCDQEEVNLERTVHHTYSCLPEAWPPQAEREKHTDKEIESI